MESWAGRSRRILTLCRFTERLRRIALTETHKMMCVCLEGRVRPGCRPFGSPSRHWKPHRSTPCLRHAFPLAGRAASNVR